MAGKPTYEELEQKVDFLQTLLDTIESEIFIKDVHGKYLFVNKAYGEDFGVDPKEVVGKDDFFVFSPGTAEILQENDRQIMARKKAVNIEESTILRGKHVTYLTNKVPFFNNDGNVIGICGIGIDVTHQKKMEEALAQAHLDLEKKVKKRTAELSETVQKLRDAKRRYRTVADFTYDWEYWSNPDGTLEYVSPSCERISGYPPRQFVEQPSLFRDIIVPEDRDIWDSHFYDSHRKPSTIEIHFRIQRSGEQEDIRWIEHVCQPINGDHGEVLGFRASNRDITRRKEAEIRLKNAYSHINELKTQLEAEQSYLREEIKSEHNFENIIGNSDSLKYVLFRTEQVAPTDTTVLILGETGTGKELIARAIHNASSRKDRPLIKVNCASLPANLIESELFGHEKGAFTDAVERRIGRFELANGATIFLDEIGELPLELQSKLLRVLQEGEFERLGSSKTLYTDVRIIAATNRDLEEDVQNKKFRMDLWYRLNVFTISIPPLRERKEDIGLLVNHMLKLFARKLGKKITTVPPDVLTKLKKYSWPGNIRELENVIERSMINSNGNTLQLNEILGTPHFEKAGPDDLLIKSLEEIEHEHILLALKKTNWVIHGEDGAAVLLKINPSTLRGRMRKHNIQRPPYKT